MNELISNMDNSYENMTESHKKIARFIMENFDDIAFSTLDELASRIGVSTTTVIRFTQKLGFEGYTNFINEVQKIIKAKVGLPEKLSISFQEKHDTLLLDSFNQDINNINNTLNNLSPEKLEVVINMIMNSANIYVIGLRTSFSVAHFFSKTLGQIRKNVRLIEAVGLVYAEEIISVKQNDLCIAFTFPRHAKVTLEVTRWMKNQGAKVISITNSNLSPISEYSDVVISCETNSVMLRNSLVAPFCLVNYIISEVIIRDKDEAMKNISITEELLRQGHYFNI